MSKASSGKSSGSWFGTFLRVDQGVDYDTPDVARAIRSGTVSRVSPKSFAGGTGDVVYVTLDKPVTVAGRTYTQIYYAERTPLVKPGDHVQMGDPIMQGGTNEIGFANANAPAGILKGGLGAGTQPTQAGQDFLTFVKGAPTMRPSPAEPAAPDTPTGAPAQQALPQAGQDTQLGTAPDPFSTQPFQPNPGSGMGSASSFAAELWSRVQPSNPDTQQLIDNANMIGS